MLDMCSVAAAVLPPSLFSLHRSASLAVVDTEAAFLALRVGFSCVNRDYLAGERTICACYCGL